MTPIELIVMLPEYLQKAPEDIRADIVRLQGLEASRELLSELGRAVRAQEIQNIRERLTARMEGNE